LSDVKQQLKEMAQLSLLANRMSETQQYNLKMFPFVFFEKIKEVKIEYDLSHGINEENKEINHNSFVSYYLKMEEPVDSIIDIRFTAIEHAVRSLFWKDVKVKVYFNDKFIYESKDV
jgi:sulfate adenylyltransferase subunit 1 (EFTu-like GTPase family)